jgi:hypothetical protein
MRDPNRGQPPPIPETTLWIDATVELSVFDPDFAICEPKQEQSNFDPLSVLKSIQPAALRYLSPQILKRSRLGAAIAGFILTASVCGLVLLVASGSDGAGDKSTVPAPKQVALSAPAPATPVDVKEQVREERPAPAPQKPAQKPALDPRPEPELEPIVLTTSTSTSTHKKAVAKVKTREKRARPRRLRGHRRSRSASSSRGVMVDVDALLRASERKASRPRSTSRSKRVDVDAILLAGADGR